LASKQFWFAVYITGKDGRMSHFPQNGGRKVIIPIVSSGIVTVDYK
jgi:hypothetical protein